MTHTDFHRPLGRAEVLALAGRLGWPAVRYYTGHTIAGETAWRSVAMPYAADRRSLAEQLVELEHREQER